MQALKHDLCKNVDKIIINFKKLKFFATILSTISTFLRRVFKKSLQIHPSCYTIMP